MSIATTGRTLEASFRDLADLREAHERELAHGGYFLRGGEVSCERELCLLVLLHPGGGRFEIRAEAVWLTAEGVGLHLLDLDDERKRRLRDFVSGDGAPVPREANPYLRLRSLPLAEQLRRARTGEMQERVALERLYGKSVWEALLANPRLSVAEVARIARKGTLPQPLIDLIAGNDAWVASAEVRRSLLSNPRLRGRPLQRVLGVLPLPELKLVEQQTGYPAHVREEARRRLRS